MTVAEHDRFLYGEPNTADDCICDTHGCRLSYLHGTGWVCPECAREEVERDRYELTIAERLWPQPYPPDDRAKCLFTQRHGITSFECTMPWWAGE